MGKPGNTSLKKANLWTDRTYKKVAVQNSFLQALFEQFLSWIGMCRKKKENDTRKHEERS